MIDSKLVQVRLYRFKPEPYLTENSFIPFQGMLEHVEVGFTILQTVCVFNELIFFVFQEA